MHFVANMFSFATSVFKFLILLVPADLVLCTGHHKNNADSGFYLVSMLVIFHLNSKLKHHQAFLERLY